MEFSPDDLRGSGLTSRDLAKQLSELDYQIFRIGRDGVDQLLELDQIGDHFSATNVLCRRRG
jgi:hypothetical protein